MKSIQRHLTVSLVCTTLAVALAGGAFLYLYARARLTTEFDRAQRVKARAISGLVLREGDGRIEFSLPESDFPEFRDARHAEFFQIWRDDGTVLARSASLQGQDLQSNAVPASSGAVSNVMLPRGRSGRAVTLSFVPRAEEDEGPAGIAARAAHPAPFTLALAADRREIDGPLKILGSALLLTAGALSAASAAVVTLTVRRSLRPLHRLSAEVGAIGADSLQRRFSIKGLPAELQPVYQRLNDLLERLDEAFQRERRFTAAAAHELRTPLSELRSLAEVALKWPDAGSAPRNYRDVLDIACQMESLVTTLLAISRAETGREAVQLRPVDLCQVIADAWAPHQAAAAARGLSMQTDLPPSFIVRSDPSLLVPLMGNLLANAVAHAPPQGIIRCGVVRNDAGMELFVANTNDSLQPEELDRLFEPFWRKDAARTGGIHCGLGLSLVAAYATALGLRVDAALPRENLFQVTVRFPSALALAPEMPTEVLNATAR